MSNEQRVGLFFIGGLVVLFSAMAMTGEVRLLEDRYEVLVDFEDVHGLSAGSEVRVGGIPAGTVSGLEFVEGAVRARLAIDADITLHNTSEIYLDYQALSGTRFVAISLGDPGSPPLQPGTVLTGAELGGLTGAFEELQKVGASIRKVANSFGENQDALLTNLTAMIEENRRTLQSTMVSMEIITGRIADGAGTLGMLSTDDRLYTEMTDAFARVSLAAEHLEVISRRLAEGQGSLGLLLTDTALYDEARETMSQLRTSASSIDEIVTQVRSGQGTLGRLVNDDSLYRETEEAVRALGRTAETIEDQAPISIMGTAVGTLF